MKSPDAAVLTSVLRAVADEIGMFLGLMAVNSVPKFTVAVNVPGTERLAETVVGNMLIEGRALHARNLSEFFAFTPKDRYIRAHHYLTSYKPLDPAALRKINERASTHVSHITMSRLSSTPNEERGWPHVLFTPVITECGRFSEELLKSPWLSNADAGLRGQFQRAVDLVPPLLAHADLIERAR